MIEIKEEAIMLVGIRVTLDKNKEKEEWYVENLMKWIRMRWNIEYYTAVAHTQTEQYHIHIHTIVTRKEGSKELKPLQNPANQIKYDYNKGKIETTYKNINIENLPKTPVEEKYKGKSNIAIKMVKIEQEEASKEEVEKWLRYPLKEGIEESIIATNLEKSIVERLMKEGHEEYLQAKRIKEKNEEYKKNRENKELSEYQKLAKYLDECHPETIHQAYRCAIIYYRDNYEKTPTGKTIVDNTERYCIKRHILTIEQLQQKYLAYY